MYHSNTVFISIHSSAKPETSVDLLGPLIIVISIHSSAKPETHRLRPQGSQWNISTHSSAKPETGNPPFAYQSRLFQSTPARSRRRQLLPISIYILHISLYKSTNVLYSPPHSSTNPPITMRFFQCESPKKLMSTYVSHHQSTISL